MPTHRFTQPFSIFPSIPPRTASYILPPTAPYMSLATKPIGVAAMPLARSSRALHFSGTNSESLSDFLREYENLADSLGLSKEEKINTILCYVPRALQSLWLELRGYLVKDWDKL
jgi:hypothetical protein